MINRDDVAREKMQRAVQMLQENGIDMWVFYTRLKVDTALELMFNTDTQNEVLFLLTRGGDRIAVALPEDAEKYEKSGLYTRVISTETSVSSPNITPSMADKLPVTVRTFPSPEVYPSSDHVTGSVVFIPSSSTTGIS